MAQWKVIIKIKGTVVHEFDRTFRKPPEKGNRIYIKFNLAKSNIRNGYYKIAEVKKRRKEVIIELT